MTSLPDHYAALGIDPTADPEVITAAYRALAKKFHPDTGAAAGTASPERFDEIQKAYEVLRTPEGRHAYDLELLAATEAELAAHLAAKRRVVPHGGRDSSRDGGRDEGREAASAGAPPPPPPPDLGDIRPEPAQPPRAAPARKPQARSGRSALPFAIPLALMAAVGAAGAWIFLPAGPEAPPLPSSAKTDSVVATAQPPAAAPEAPAAKPAEAPAPPQAAGPAPAPAAAPAEKPVFGSTASEPADPVIEEASAPPEDGVPAAAASAGKSDKPAEPVFGSTADATPPPAAELPPPPLPKVKPAQPKPVAKKTVAAPKPAQPKPQKQASAQPRAKLTYQDPPQYDPGYGDRYDPRYDNGDYPPPGLEPPPGFEPPPGYGEPDYPPQGYAPGGGPYRLVIFERQPGRPATAWSAGVVFKSFGKCTRQGVKAVLRRTGDMDPYAETRVWYECQRLSQR